MVIQLTQYAVANLVRYIRLLPLLEIASDLSVSKLIFIFINNNDSPLRIPLSGFPLKSLLSCSSRGRSGRLLRNNKAPIWPWTELLPAKASVIPTRLQE